MARARKTKDLNPGNCPVTHVLNRIGGHWKILILHGIHQGVDRFSLLQKALPLISKQSLVDQLRELEADGFIQRTTFAEVPRRVCYHLTDHGRSLGPVIRALYDWGERDMQAQARPTSAAQR